MARVYTVPTAVYRGVRHVLFRLPIEVEGSRAGYVYTVYGRRTVSSTIHPFGSSEHWHCHGIVIGSHI